MNWRLVILLLCLSLSQAYVYTCLDNCDCDTVDEIIHCQNGERSELNLPAEERLRGFPVIALSFNNIVKLPSEETLRSKFPDVKLIDVERNPFDCASLDEYRKITIISDCFKNSTEVMRVERVMRPTKDCDSACQIKKHNEQLREYTVALVKAVKNKFDNFDFNETLDFVKNVIIKMSQNVETKQIETKAIDAADVVTNFFQAVVQTMIQR